MLAARSAQFQYGTHKTDYKTSVNQNFITHDLGQVAEAKKERQENGADLRRSHFMLGTDKDKVIPAKTEKPSFE